VTPISPPNMPGRRKALFALAGNSARTDAKADWPHSVQLADLVSRRHGRPTEGSYSRKVTLRWKSSKILRYVMYRTG
jgi:hypothetical protein